jgi:hypothetical protein
MPMVFISLVFKEINAEYTMDRRSNIHVKHVVDDCAIIIDDGKGLKSSLVFTVTT